MHRPPASDALEADRAGRRPYGHRANLDVREAVAFDGRHESAEALVVGLERDDASVLAGEPGQQQCEEAGVRADVPDDGAGLNELGQARLQLGLDPAEPRLRVVPHVEEELQAPSRARLHSDPGTAPPRPDTVTDRVHEPTEQWKRDQPQRPPRPRAAEKPPYEALGSEPLER